MCLGIPMKVASIDTAGDHAEGIVSSAGVRRKANFSLLRDVKVGDYVVLHAGFAIEKVKEAEAKKTIRLIREL
jgi:hydrogenase expression/formation protein HypC